MMDLFGEHSLPAHIAANQTEAKAVLGVRKAADVLQHHMQAQCCRNAHKMNQQ